MKNHFIVYNIIINILYLLFKFFNDFIQNISYLCLYNDDILFTKFILCRNFFDYILHDYSLFFSLFSTLFLFMLFFFLIIYNQSETLIYYLSITKKLLKKKRYIFNLKTRIFKYIVNLRIILR